MAIKPDAMREKEGATDLAARSPDLPAQVETIALEPVPVRRMPGEARDWVRMIGALLLSLGERYLRRDTEKMGGGGWGGGRQRRRGGCRRGGGSGRRRG